MSTIEKRVKTIQDSKRQNRIAVLAGAGVTLVATIFFLFLSALIPLQDLKIIILETTSGWMYGNPFHQLRFFGPAVGGVVAGYLAVDINGRHTWTTSIKYGGLAAAVGIGFVYVIYAGLIAIRYVSAIVRDPEIGATVPHALDIVLVPMFFTLPLLPIAFFEGLLAGAVGNSLRYVLIRR